MREVLSSFLSVGHRRLKVGWPPITQVHVHEFRMARLSAAILGRGPRLIIVAFLLINVFSCSNKNDLPKGVLSKEEMAKILTEFYMREARINTIHVSQDSGQNLMQLYRNKYAEQTGIPDSTVELSYQYYLAHPVELGEIYDRIIDSLALKEQRTSIDSGPKPVE